jgi:CRISPR/Cas system-associated protein Cas5 (RAMP superfamily)
LEPKISSSVKTTYPRPTKSAISGLICNAMGYDRDNMMDDDILKKISDLKMHIRVDMEGQIVSDYCVSGGRKLLGKKYGVYRADGALGDSVIRYKHYISNAKFIY